MEKKVKAGSVAIGICLFIMLILVIAIALVSFKYRNDMESKNAEIANLNSKIEEKEDRISGLEDKVDSISNIINSGKEEKEETKNSSSEVEKKKEKTDTTKSTKTDSAEDSLYGTYIPMKSWPGDAPVLNIEKNGKIELDGNDAEIGEYTIKGNELDVKYTSIIEPGESKPTPENRTSKIKIIDENTVESTSVVDGTTYVLKYVKEEYYKKIEEKAQKCISGQNKVKVDSMGLNEIKDNTCVFGAYIEENGITDLYSITFDTTNGEYKILKVEKY